MLAFYPGKTQPLAIMILIDLENVKTFFFHDNQRDPSCLVMMNDSDHVLEDFV